MIDMDILTEDYFSTDEPVPYELKCGIEILIYPVKVKDWGKFNSSLGVLTIDKNEINEIEFIRISYLDFIIRLLCEDIKWFERLGNVIKYSLHEDLISVEEHNGKNVLTILNNDATIKGFITSKEFDEIKRIILFQNIYDYDDVELSPDIKKIIKDYQDLTSANSTPATLENKMCLIGNESGLTKKEIVDMTYREFSIRFDILIDKIEYQLCKSAELNGTKFKAKTEHFIFKKKKDKLSQFFVDSDALADVIGEPTHT